MNARAQRLQDELTGRGVTECPACHASNFAGSVHHVLLPLNPASMDNPHRLSMEPPDAFAVALLTCSKCGHTMLFAPPGS